MRRVMDGIINYMIVEDIDIRYGLMNKSIHQLYNDNISAIIISFIAIVDKIGYNIINKNRKLISIPLS